MGIILLCAVVAGVAFAAGGYAGLIRSVDRLGEPRNAETHPTAYTPHRLAAPGARGV